MKCKGPDQKGVSTPGYIDHERVIGKKRSLNCIGKNLDSKGGGSWDWERVAKSRNTYYGYR